jgi:hypothetical protein
MSSGTRPVHDRAVWLQLRSDVRCARATNYKSVQVSKYTRLQLFPDQKHIKKHRGASLRRESTWRRKKLIAPQ